MHAVLLSIPARPDAWCQRLAVGSPENAVFVQNLVPLDGGGCIETILVTGRDSAAAVERVRADKGVGEVEVVERREDATVARVRVMECPVSCVMRRTGLVPQLPFAVVPGADRWLIVGQTEALRRSMSELEKEGIRAELLWTGPWDVDKHALTDHQRRVLLAAVEVGYYEYPRRITLTKLAVRVGISKSTLSETLMVIEKKVVRGFLERS